MRIDRLNAATILRSLDRFPYPIFLTDDKLVIAGCNSAFADLLGLAKETIPGKVTYDLFPPSFADIQRGLTKLAAQKQSYQAHECLFQAKDGFAQEVELGILEIGEQDPWFFNVMLYADRTAAKGAQLGRDLYQTLFQTAPTGIMIIGKNGSVLDINPKLLELMGSPALSATMQLNILEDPPLSAAGIAEKVKACLETGKYGASEHHYISGWNKEAYLSMHLSPLLDNQGDIIGAQAMLEDISQRILLEKQLVQAQKLESIGQLAAGIAHEINTPIQYIGDNLSFLKDAFHDLQSVIQPLLECYRFARENGALDAESAARYEALSRQINLEYLLNEVPTAIQQSIEGIDRVADIVQAMKAFSHPGGKEKAPIDIHQALDTTLKVAHNEWKYVADVVTEYDRTLPLIPLLGEFNQVLLNLVINAAHAIASKGEEKGTITVRTLRCEECAEIRIRDSGTGIPKAIQHKIFEPFFTTKAVGKGTGQGLTFAYNTVVEKLGGSLEFESAEGEGTTFIIRLPLV